MQPVGVIDVGSILNKANLAWVLPRWSEAFTLYKVIENSTSGHQTGHVAYRLGLLYKKGYGGDNEVSAHENYFKTAKDLVAKGAEEGDCEALCDLGHMHENGNAGFAVNVPLATQYYKNAADKGHARGLYNLAVMLQHEGSRETAQQYYKMAALKDYPCAQFNLACMLKSKDLKLALHYFAKAASWGDGDAQRELSKVFSDKSNPDRTAFLVEEWRDYFCHLHYSCQVGVKESVRVLKVFEVLPELIELIMDEIIRAWPTHLHHFQVEDPQQHQK